MDNSKPLQIEDEKIDTDGMCRILGSSERPADRSTVWRAVKRGYIPKPRYLTPARPYWLRREILALVEQPAEGLGDHKPEAGRVSRVSEFAAA